MKILTLKNPWAAAIFVSPIDLVPPKSIENRVWWTDLRDVRIGIHAGKAVDRNAGIPMPNHPVFSAVLGTVEITGCHEARSQQCGWHGCAENPWAQWPDKNHPVIFHWEMEHPREFVTPIPAKGALKFWEPGPSVEHLMSIADFVVQP